MMSRTSETMDRARKIQNPIQARPRGQLDKFREPWISIGMGWYYLPSPGKTAKGPDWSQTEVDNMIKSSRQLQQILLQPIQQEVYLSAKFLSTTNKRDLTFEHLSAVIVQSRGQQVKAVKCYRCSSDRLTVFDKCITMKDYYNSACGADVWHSTGANCAYNSRTGMNVDPTPSSRTNTINLCNQAVKLANQSRYDLRPRPATKFRTRTATAQSRQSIPSLSQSRSATVSASRRKNIPARTVSGRRARSLTPIFIHPPRPIARADRPTSAALIKRTRSPSPVFIHPPRPNSQAGRSTNFINIGPSLQVSRSSSVVFEAPISPIQQPASPATFSTRERVFIDLTLVGN